MSYVVRTAPPAAEPISLIRAKNYLRLDSGFTVDDQHIQSLISAAREHAERVTGKALAQGTFRQVMDSFPYYTDTIQSQLAFPPSYYSLPMYSTTLWNYSQMIKLFYPPIISVQQIRFVGSDGNVDTLNQDVDFILDRLTNPARIFPVPGQYWPPAYYTPNSCEIDFTAGYQPEGASNPIDTHTISGSITPPGQQPDSIMLTSIPATIVRIMLMLINFWNDNRDREAPPEIDSMLQAEACIDFQPTRG